MSAERQISFGVVGAGGRGGSFEHAFRESERATVRAVCDREESVLEDAKATLDAEESYTDYDEMLWESDVDAVVLGTPMHLHVNQSIAALERGIHVLSEVPVGVGIGECRDLVDACAASDAKYMMAENYIYKKSNVLVKALVDAGLFGDLYYAEADYLHELKGLMERTKWRRTWTSGRNGISYPTHCLGPVLDWMPDDRIAEVVCSGSGHHYTDARGDTYEIEDSLAMLAKTERGRLVKVRRDILSERPYAMDNYQLQGTEGSYESARSDGERDRVWLGEYEGDEDSHEYTWRDLSEFEAQYLPEMWRDPPETVRQSGHGGSDYFLVQDFIDCLADDKPVPINVHDALDMTLPGLCSIESIDRGGEWVSIPDSRKW